MKQIEAIVPINVSRDVIKSIRDLGVSGVTLVESRGQGEGERPELQGKQAEFNPTDLIITVVEDSQLDDIVSAILDTAHTGEKTDGKIFITEVKMAYDIATKQKSTELI
jgi:nitrogen regulatory protein P-II 1